MKKLDKESKCQEKKLSQNIKLLNIKQNMSLKYFMINILVKKFINYIEYVPVDRY